MDDCQIDQGPLFALQHRMRKLPDVDNSIPFWRLGLPSAFNFSVSPFDCLSNDERKLVRDNLDIEYFRQGGVVLDPATAPTHLFVVIKGFVQQFEDEELITTYGPDDCFDGRSLMGGKVSGKFIAAEEVLVYRLAKQTVLDLIALNATFGALLFSDLPNKLTALANRHSQHELQSLTMARVEQTVIRPATYVDADTDIVSIVRIFNDKKITSVLVRDDKATPPQLGIYTNTGLQRAILDGRPLHKLPVRELTTFKLVTTTPSDYVFEALSTMIRHRVQRLVVVDDAGAILGLLEQLDLLSFLSNQSYLITRQILEAQDLKALEPVVAQITRMIGLLFRGGTKVHLIARMVQELNAKLFERTWQLVAPADLVANSCLFVMGSEGRGEQLLKTDQDNGLVLRDDYTPPADLPEICQRFSDALKEFGYPECPGKIMINNEAWRHPAKEFGEIARNWLLKPDGESLMALAIFLDAHAICGDVDLLETVRDDVFKLVNGNEPLLARFADAINAFSTGSGWWNKILLLGDGGKEAIDLKKIGTFPLVHGIRSMALEHRIRETGTARRIETLVQAGHLGAEIGTDLLDSLHFFMSLKLKNALDAMELGKPSSTPLTMDRLSALDRDLMKDALAVVKRFKSVLRARYHLDNL